MAEKEIELSVEDLVNALRIFNSATERGAFKANELSFVGRTYDKFSAFVKAAQEQSHEVNSFTEEVEAFEKKLDHQKNINSKITKEFEQ